MFKTLLLIATLAAAGADVRAAGVTYTLDPTHTNVLASWNHLGFAHPSAQFGAVAGTLVYDAEDVAKSRVQVTLPLSGLDSFVPKLDIHLRDADFFDAEKFPVISYTSTRVEDLGGGRLRITGDLTVKDTTRPVVMIAQLNRIGVHPLSKRPSIGFDATATLKRSEFGVAGYVPLVSDEISLRITTEASIAE
jgi:polyisoprenoid-binding protein YceI